MKNNKKLFALPVAGILIIIFVMIFVFKIDTQVVKKELNASWAYCYADINELTKDSDLIALIKVKGIEESASGSLPFTIYRVAVEDSVLGCEEGKEVLIYMTGIKNSDFDISITDDPLLDEGDEFLIFAQKNSDETYTILSGPQGRLKYEDGKLTSLKYIYDEVARSNDFMPVDVKNEDYGNIVDEIKKLI